MSNSYKQVEPVDFLARFTASDQFDRVFKEGMGLVEETANYLDGLGRTDVRFLDRHGAVAYATESMRLTTRLMQLASWLLLQRAISAGELTEEAAAKEQSRIKLFEIGRGQELAGAEQLPGALLELIERSLRLHQRILTLDAMLSLQGKYQEASSPVNDQLDRLASLFNVARG